MDGESCRPCGGFYVFMKDKHPSLSNIQISAQEEMLQDFERRNRGVKLEREKVLPVGVRSTIRVDGYSVRPAVVCEVWAHVGAPRGSQPSKIMEDALKMLFLEKHERRTFRKVLIFADAKSSAKFENRTWMAACLQKFDIKIFIAELLPETLTAILEAQQRQRR